jgi:hypothetical protein
MTNGRRLTPVDGSSLLNSTRSNYSYSSPPPPPHALSSPHVSLSRISPPSPLSHQVFPPAPLWPILLPPLPDLLVSLNPRHFCNRGPAATAPFYPGFFCHPLRVLYPALRSAVSVCSACLEGCPTNTARLSPSFSSSTTPCSSSHSSKACVRRLLGASHRCSSEALIFAYTHFYTHSAHS